MKWFKHYTNAHKGEAILHLRTHFKKAEAYGLYFLFTEYFADKWDGSSEPIFKILAFDLSSFLGLKQNKLSSFLECLKNEQKINFTHSENVIEINFPKLAEVLHRDALSSGQRPASSRPHSSVEKKKKKKKSSCPEFLNLESLLAAIPQEKQDGWAKLYPKEFIDRELIRAWNYYADEKPKTLQGWSRAMGGWLERQTKWNANDAGAKRPLTGGWADTDGVS